MESLHKKSFAVFLENLRRKAKNKWDKGRLFEKAIGKFLKQSPEYNFSHVWMWKDWPDLSKYNFSKKDLGIDLVAKEKETGEFWAIQCKCYDKNHPISKGDIDTFFSLSGKKPFKKRLFVTTSTKWGKNAKATIDGQSKNCTLIDLTKLEKAEFDWTETSVKRRAQKEIRPHQKKALESVKHYFSEGHERGKLIMACGTGKTFTSLRIVEKLTPKTGRVLFLAPSISLISQTLREYAYERKDDQRYLVICSDKKSGKDSEGEDVLDLQIPPTTQVKEIVEVLRKQSSKRTIVFCTYQSLSQITKAQAQKVPPFDLIVCDEAHRTTGVDGKSFTLVHDREKIKAHRRLYMTATPRIYTENVKAKAEKCNVVVHSMDDEKTFGQEIFNLNFSKAIDQKLLCDYKVTILSINQTYTSNQIQSILDDTELNLDDASKLVGVYKALRDQGREKGKKLARAVGFASTINFSKKITNHFDKVVGVLNEYQNDGFTCETDHVDGTHSSLDKNAKLDWLREPVPNTKRGEKVCRVLMNAKCLTEGVDVPNLDAVLFLHPRKSQVDIVQAVGRVMRKQEGKKYGYIVLPIVLPSGKTPEEALNDNKTYRVVWQVLNALRSHDSSFDNKINNLKLNDKKPEQIDVIGIGYDSEKEKKDIEDQTDPALILNRYSIEDIRDQIYVKIVDKCGDRIYSEKWVKKITESHATLSTRIRSLLKNKKIGRSFDSYLKGLQTSLNPEIDEKDAVSMLAEHMLTRPAFDKIFENYKFSKNNSISKALKSVIDQLDRYGFRHELADLGKFYEGISKRLEGIDNSKGRQTVIKELYEDFIKTAFKDTADKLGVAYTPVEVVDFIIESVNDLLNKHFKKSLSDRGVHIIDPFSGTGTFLNRLISNKKFINSGDLKRKFAKELWFNEILLLPYYISCINIEEAYHGRIGGQYKEFPGSALVDTFNLGEEIFNGKSLFKENRKNIERQKRAPIQVIVGNPPYSIGQKSANDGNRNTTYPKLEKKIKETYAAKSNAGLKKALYDSYVKAIRWATDRMGEGGGVIGFITNASFLDGISCDGLRKSLVEEFDEIYVFNLKGNQRTKGEVAKREGEGVFGQSTRTPVSIIFFLKNPGEKRKQANIFYREIGDYLSRKEKLEEVHLAQSYKKIKWRKIIPDKYGDWINQRDDSFFDFLPMGNENGTEDAIFNLRSCGVLTSRDSWVYNFSPYQLGSNIKKMIDFYNAELRRLENSSIALKNMDRFIDRDKSKVSWSRLLKKIFLKRKQISFNKKFIRKSSYRPFAKLNLYFCRDLNECQYNTAEIFPQKESKNLVICVSGKGANSFSVLITDKIPDLNYLQAGAAQCFPLYKYDKQGNQKEAIGDIALTAFREHYNDTNISKKDIFYYIYGILHSKEYRERYQANLTKGLPRIPFASDFKAFERAGRKLADIHLNYENQSSPRNVEIWRDGKKVRLDKLSAEDLRVEKIRENKRDRSEIFFNQRVALKSIPKEVWDYKIGEWSAVKHVIARYQYKINKDSRIVNDPNSYSDDPRYVLNLLLSVISVSLKSLDIIKGLPALNIEGVDQSLDEVA